MARSHHARGFTFVEMMVAGTILVSITTMAALWLTGVSELWSVSTAQSDVRLRAQETVSRVLDELRSATLTAGGSPPNATIPGSPNNISVTFYLPAANPNFNNLMLDANGNTNWNPYDAGGNILPPVPIQYAYVAAQGQLVRTVGGQSQVIARDVSGVVFKNRAIDGTLNSNEIQITLTLQRTAAKGRVVSAAATEIVKLRN